MSVSRTPLVQCGACHEPAPTRRWQPGVVHWGTAAVHTVGAAAAVAQPSWWPWIVGALATNHALNLTCSALPATRALGPVICELPATSAARQEVALTFDDGPDPHITPRVLDLLDAAQARATFFCVGARARAAPALVREIVARGHAVENHSDSHSIAFGFYGPRRLIEDIGAAQRSLADITGVQPRFFRAPFGVRTPFTEPALARLGLECVAWSVRTFDSIDSDSVRVVQRVQRKLAAGAIVLMHDGLEARHRARPGVLAMLPAVLEHAGRLSARCVTLRTALVN